MTEDRGSTAFTEPSVHGSAVQPATCPHKAMTKPAATTATPANEPARDLAAAPVKTEAGAEVAEAVALTCEVAAAVTLPKAG